MKETRKQQLITTAIHILAWSLLGLILFYFTVLNGGSITRGSRLIALIIYVAAVYYLNHFLLIPKLLLKRKFWAYGASICVLFFLATLVPASPPPPPPDMIPDFPRPRGPFGRTLNRETLPRLILFMATLLSTLLSITFRLIGHWNKRERQQTQQQAQQLQTELNFLKNQVSPHFFFNTLNSIYALTESDPELARKVIHRLSKMMRYLLYESEETNRVSLGKEVEFLESYIELMKVRLPDSVTVNYRSKVIQPSAMLPPLLMIPLVENAFKHGVSLKKPIVVSIELEQLEGMARLTTENEILEGSAFKEEGGIGLTNLRRRLEIIYDNDQYELMTLKENNTFKAQLSINIWPSSAS